MSAPAINAPSTVAPPQDSRAERWRVAWVFWEWCLIREACRAGPYRILVAVPLLAVFVEAPLITAPPWRVVTGGDMMDFVLIASGLAVLLGGFAHAAHAVCWEVSRELRDMVRLTGINSSTLLWCKTLARWWTILVSLLLLAPFAAFAVTQGGVTVTQLWAGAWWLLMFALLTAGFAAVASVSSVEADNAAATASVATFFLMLLYHVVFWIVALLVYLVDVGFTMPPAGTSHYPILRAFFSFAIEATPVSVAHRTMTSPALFSPLDPRYWLHFFTAAACLRMASLVMRNRMRVSPKSDTSPAAANYEAPAVASVFRPRCGERPFFWKDTQVLGGGGSTQRIADVVYVLFAIAVLFTLTRPNSDQLRPAIAVIAECLAPIVLALRFDGLLAAEFRQQTWSSLMLLPIDHRVVVWSKLQAVLWEQRMLWLPVSLAVALGLPLQPMLVAMAGVIAALAGLVMCQVSAINRIAPKTWWIGPVQGVSMIGLILVCLMTWLGNDPWTGFVINVALLLVAIFPAQWWIDYLLREWTEA